MKRRILCLFAAAIAVPAFSNADTIDIISQTYSIAGSYGLWADPASWTSFSLSGSTPVSLSDILSDPGAGATYARGSANASTGSFSVDVGAGYSVRSSCSAEIVWRASENGLLDLWMLQNKSGADAGWNLVLEDLTTSTTVFQGHILPLGIGTSTAENLPIESSHVYSLRASAGGSGTDVASVSASGTLHSAPDASSMGLLLGLGLAGLAGVGLRFPGRR